MSVSWVMISLLTEDCLHFLTFLQGEEEKKIQQPHLYPDTKESVVPSSIQWPVKAKARVIATRHTDIQTLHFRISSNAGVCLRDEKTSPKMNKALFRKL